MTTEEQANFLHAAFDVFYMIDGQGTCARQAAFAAFLAGFLSAAALLHQLAEADPS